MIQQWESIVDLLATIDKADGINVWGKRMRLLNPKNVLELGTGQGATGALIMACLAVDGLFTTIDSVAYSSELDLYKSDPRLRCVVADAHNQATLEMVTDGVDLMFMDTEHEASIAAGELRLWQRKLCDGAIVIVDDLSMNNMSRFWDSLCYDKGPANALLGQGTFRYDASRPYEVCL